jgi:DNA-binding MarR family transcriptional regulator
VTIAKVLLRMPRRADVSLLFDLFVAGQRVRRVLADGMAGSGMRADEYAVYSLLFMFGPLTSTEMARQLGLPLSTMLDYLKAIDGAGHLEREPHPDDGRAIQLALNSRGVRAHSRANQHWEIVRKQVEGSLRMPKAEVRAALQALDDAASSALETRRKAARQPVTYKGRTRTYPGGFA